MAVMIPPGQWVGYYLDIAPDPVSAYSANLLGSVAGIWAFAGLAFISLPPAYWFCAAILFSGADRPWPPATLFLSWLLAGVCVFLFHLGGSPESENLLVPLPKTCRGGFGRATVSD